MNSAQEVANASRNDAIDVLKGIGIFFVVANHCFARGSRKFLDAEVTETIGLYAINRAIHFAVPMFLFISCVLLAKSLAKNFDLKRYSLARFRKTVIPYIVASVSYYLLILYSNGSSQFSWGDLVRQMAYGKAYFHLYFTVVLIQVSVAIPFLVRYFHCRKFGWVTIALGAMALQMVIYTLQRTIFHFERPGSIILWYVVPVLLGSALGASSFNIDDLAKYSGTLKWTTLLAGALYVLSSIAPLLSFPTSSDMINGSFVAFTASVAMLLFVHAPRFPMGTSRKLFARLGQVSLPLFLVHPAIMHFLGGPRVSVLLGDGPGSLFVYWVLTLLLSFGIGALATRFGPFRLILGESWSPRLTNVAKG